MNAAGGTGTIGRKKNGGDRATSIIRGRSAGGETTATGLLEQQCPRQGSLALHAFQVRARARPEKAY